MFFKNLLKKREVSKERTYGQIYEDLGNVVDEALKDCLKLADVNLMDCDLDSIADLSDEEMLMVKRAITAYRDIMKLSSEMAALADRQEKTINALDSKVDSLNEELLKMNKMITKLCESMS